MNTEDFGLVVGINDYPNNPPFEPLQGAKRDAQDFLDWLRLPTGGGVPAANVDPYTKLSDAAGTEPMFHHLLGLLVGIRKRAPAGKKRVGRRLYLFLAGHGVSPTDLDEAGLVTVDGMDIAPVNLPGKSCADQFCLAGRFDEVLLFMDCCRVTDLLLEKTTIPVIDKPVPGAAARVRRFFAFATAFGKVAREAPHGGTVRGLFSQVLLDGLRGGVPPDAQGRITTTQLRAYIEGRMKGIIIDGEEQVPKFPASDEIVLVDGLAPGLVTVHLTLAGMAAGLVVLDGGNNLAPVAPLDLEETPNGRRFRLPAGKSYVAQAVDAAGHALRTTILQAVKEDVHATL